MSSADARHEELTRLRRVRDRIDREFAQPLTLVALAAGAYMSQGHLSRTFKAAYGESPYSYVMTRRVERAAYLLRQSTLSVTEVCFDVGFTSPGTFSTRFTELMGVSPSQYRRQGDVVADGLDPCLARAVLRPIRNQEVTISGPH